MAYLVCFAASTALAYFANKSKKPKLFWLLFVLSILVPVMLAALRDWSVGTDTMNYYTMPRFWAGAISAESLGAYLKYYVSLGYKEYAFAFFCGIIARIFRSYGVFLFLAHAVIITSVHVGAFRMKRYANPALVLLLFYLMYYNASLNILRQFMAMGIVFAFSADLELGKYVRYLLAVLFASLIHTTALLAVVPLALSIILYTKRFLDWSTHKRMIALCALVVVGALCFIPITKFLIRISVIPAKYSFYFQNEVSQYSKTRLALRFLEILVLCICYKKLKKRNKHTEFYVVNTVLFLAMLQISNFIVYGQRIATHFALTNIVTIAMLPRCYEDKRIRYIFIAIIVALISYYWYHTYVLGGANGTIPYAFKS